MFGFGAGKIELKLPRTMYAAGEAIEGTLLLTVNMPVKARGLFVTLSAEQQIREQVRNRGKTEMNTVTRKIYNYQQQLDTEREYEKTSVQAAYPFSILMPPMAQAAQDATDPLHGFAISWGGLHIDGGPGPVSPAKWTLEGYLDLPLAIDVKASVGIGVVGGKR